MQADRVFKVFRAAFVGKCNPVHYFWGAAHLAVTRFSGRPAPPHPDLPYEAVRQAASPDETLLAFLQTTYEAVANLGKWDRSALERGADPGAASEPA